MSRCELCDDAAPEGRFCSRACQFLNPRFHDGTFMKLEAKWTGLLVPRLPNAVGAREPAWRHWDAFDTLYLEYERLLAEERPEPPGLVEIRRRITQTLTQPRGQRATAWRLPKTEDQGLLVVFGERRTVCADWLTQVVTQNPPFANRERRWRLRKLLERTNRDLIDAAPSLGLVWLKDGKDGKWDQSKWLKREYTSLDRLERKMTPKRATYLERPVAKLQTLVDQMGQKPESDDEYYCRVKYLQLQLYAYERIYLLIYLGHKAKLDKTTLRELRATLGDVHDDLVRTSLAALRGETPDALPNTANQSITQKMGPLIRTALAETESDDSVEKRKQKDKADETQTRSTDSSKHKKHKDKKDKKGKKDKKNKDKNKRSRSGDETRSSDKAGRTKKSKQTPNTNNNNNNNNTAIVTVTDESDTSDNSDNAEVRAAYIMQLLQDQSLKGARRHVLEQMRDMYLMDEQ